MTEPLAVWDVSDPAWWRGHEVKSQWLRDHGIAVDHTYRVEFYLVDMPFARVFSYRVNDEGRRYLDHHDPGLEHDHSLCEVAKLPPHDLPLNELPPLELRGLS